MEDHIPTKAEIAKYHAMERQAWQEYFAVDPVREPNRSMALGNRWLEIGTRLMELYRIREKHKAFLMMKGDW